MKQPRTTSTKTSAPTRGETKTRRGAAKSKNPVGRPKDYDPDLHPWLAETLAAAGLTDAEIAGRLGKAEKTIENWKKYPEFLQALKRGKKPANEQVKRSLFQRAIGYSYPSEEVFCAFGKVTRVATMKHCPPDVTAGVFWLCNRDRENWKHVSHLLHSGELKTGPVVFVSGLPETAAPQPAAAPEMPGSGS